MAKVISRASRTSSLRKNIAISPAAQRKLLEQLRTTEDEIENETNLHGESSWHVRALKFLHSPAVELTLMGLLVFDILILFVDMWMEPEHPDCYQIVSNAVCQDGSEVSCIMHEEPPIVHLADGLSLAITCIFMAENIALVTILGFQQFFGNIFYAVDFIVVATSLGLEVTFLILGEDDLAALVGLLLLARLWRFVRLGHGLISTTVKKDNKTIERLEDRIKEMEGILKKHGLQVPGETEKSKSDSVADSVYDFDYFAMT